ncbi:GNAT family N-acetyltransferase [Burkholderia seminalis]|uniref:GNAT family N-acetyltransferase n=2 Tax=Burkholderia TaxID=32008 RepID=UPI000F5A2F15|nr:GNAT family N-acetyltransferase [Burkholderia seminalis]MBN3737493.1 GNAT family N-acetyltransferase [Burkholderia sp. Tr-20355]RQS68585.1 N-acetyltransferase [Burkholderia seminalis]
MNSYRIRLREHAPSDADRFCELQMSSPVARYVSWLPRTREQCERALADAIAQQRSAERVRFFYAVEFQHVDGMIGSVGYTVRDAGSADCGRFLLPAFRGNGYAAPAVRELLQRAFGSGGIVSMAASCSVGNRASVRVAEKCGFRLIAEIHGRAHFEIRLKDFHALAPNGPD